MERGVSFNQQEFFLRKFVGSINSRKRKERERKRERERERLRGCREANAISRTVREPGKDFRVDAKMLSEGKERARKYKRSE